ncbi:MAG: dTDP-4-dehydrorhamnose reductase [bacterium]
MKILVTGANGMVGSYFPKIFDKDKLVLTDIEDLDVRDPDAAFKWMEKENPDIVYHLAAKTDVDKCELEVEDAYLTNTIGTQNIALACQKYNKVMVYISTAGVFDGKKIEPYTEFDLPNPVNIYGKTKLEGEVIVRDLLYKFYIVRAGWMMGGGPAKDKKFVYKVIRISEINEVLRAVNDKFGSPTYALDLVKGLKELTKTGYFGLYHMTNTGIVCSRYEVAIEIFKILNNYIKIIPVSSAYFPLPALRARSEAMQNMKLDLLKINKMRSWKAALKEYLRESTQN